MDEVDPGMDNTFSFEVPSTFTDKRVLKEMTMMKEKLGKLDTMDGQLGTIDGQLGTMDGQIQ